MVTIKVQPQIKKYIFRNVVVLFAIHTREVRKTQNVHLKAKINISYSISYPDLRH